MIDLESPVLGDLPETGELVGLVLLPGGDADVDSDDHFLASAAGPKQCVRFSIATLDVYRESPVTGT